MLINNNRLVFLPKQLYFVNFYSTFSHRTRSADFVKVAAAGTLRESANVKLVLNHAKITLHVR